MALNIGSLNRNCFTCPTVSDSRREDIAASVGILGITFSVVSYAVFAGSTIFVAFSGCSKECIEATTCDKELYQTSMASQLISLIVGVIGVAMTCFGMMWSKVSQPAPADSEDPLREGQAIELQEAENMIEQEEETSPSVRKRAFKYIAFASLPFIIGTSLFLSSKCSQDTCLKNCDDKLYKSGKSLLYTGIFTTIVLVADFFQRVASND